MDHLLTDKSDRALRHFGLIVGVMFFLVFGLCLPWILDRPVPKWPYWIGTALVILAISKPKMLRPVYWTWIRVGHGLGWLNTRIILTLAYVLLIVPMAVILRVFRMDSMRRRPEPLVTSYKIKCRQREPKHMERPY